MSTLAWESVENYILKKNYKAFLKEQIRLLENNGIPKINLDMSSMKR